jgi:glutamyl-tRNA synthetase
MKVRFAPSPTGYLHVGNARIALANALFARRTGAAFLLRLDDTDVARSRPEYEDAISHDLHWLGIGWDETFRQTDRLAHYEAAADKLRAAGRLYPCFESEEELRAKRELRVKRGLAPVYDRAMLKLTAEQRANAEAGGKRPHWRFKLSPDAAEWNDLVLGRKSVKLPAVSDPVLIREDGTFLYTFTSVVDDIESGITHIIRGEDHVTNTGVQLDIVSALGANPTKLSFAHLPLLVDTDGGKLSKRLEGLSLRSLRQDGMEPTALTAYLARVGTSASPEPLDLPALAETFDFSTYSRSPARFDVRQLLALNRRVLHDAPFAKVHDRLPSAATEIFWNAIRGNLDLLSEARHWWDVVAGDLIPPVIEGEAIFFGQALHYLPEEPWGPDTWRTWTDALKDASGRRGRALFQPLRMALTGEEHGPELAQLLPLIGRAKTASRLRLSALDIA